MVRWIDHDKQSKMLIVEFRWRLHGCSLYNSFNFSVYLQLAQCQGVVYPGRRQVMGGTGPGICPLWRPLEHLSTHLPLGHLQALSAHCSFTIILKYCENFLLYLKIYSLYHRKFQHYLCHERKGISVRFF